MELTLRQVYWVKYVWLVRLIFRHSTMVRMSRCESKAYVENIEEKVQGLDLRIFQLRSGHSGVLYK
jgi:hypothetical protein